jgi:predicted small integral membrane protein
MFQSDTVNPRQLREHFESWQGRRVSVGLSTNHYLVGAWLALDHHDAKFRIGEHEVTVKVAEIAVISEAEPLQADFFK